MAITEYVDCTPEAVSESIKARLEHMDALLEQRAVVQGSFLEWQASKKLQKSRKARYDADQADLDILMDEDPSQKKLFDKAKFRDGKPNSIPEFIPPPSSQQPAWESFDVSHLGEHGISSKQCEKLAVGLSGTDGSMGALQKLMQQDGIHWSKSISGIGKTVQQKIEDAFNEFVVEHSATDDAEAEPDHMIATEHEGVEYEVVDAEAIDLSHEISEQPLATTQTQSELSKSTFESL